MSKNEIIEKIKRLPIGLRFCGAGGILAFISVFLPWYSDVDIFKTGNEFLAISGPLYLSGLLILALSFISAGIVAMKTFDKKLPKLPIEEPYLFILSGCASLFLLLLTSSVYFHSKFGVNITQKTAGIGMILCVIGSVLILAGGLLQNRRKGISFEVEGKLEQLIDMNSGANSRTAMPLHRQDQTHSVAAPLHRPEHRPDHNFMPTTPRHSPQAHPVATPVGSPAQSQPDSTPSEKVQVNIESKY